MEFKVGDVVKSRVFSDADAEHIFTGKINDYGCMVCKRVSDGLSQGCQAESAILIRRAGETEKPASISTEAGKPIPVDDFMEFDVLKKCFRNINLLSKEQRARVLNYLWKRFEGGEK